MYDFNPDSNFNNQSKQSAPITQFGPKAVCTNPVVNAKPIIINAATLKPLCISSLKVDQQTPNILLTMNTHKPSAQNFTQ